MKTPPLLSGAAIMFWGIEMRQPLLAAMMAVAVETSRWIKSRWDFKETDFKAVSALCTLALVGLALYQFFTGWFNHSAWMVMKWLPLALLPLFLMQLFSTGGSIHYSALFLFRQRNITADAGRSRKFDLSYMYQAICVFSAGFVNQRDGFFYIGLLAIAVWALWTYRQRQSSLAVWVSLMLVAGGLGYFGQIGLAKLQILVEQRTTHLFTPRGDTYRKYTQIGDIPNEKLSSRIVFRARTGGKDERSLLLREATYDTFRSIPSIWSVSHKHFKPLQEGLNRASWLLAKPSPDARTCEIAQHLNGDEALLKLPGGAFQVENLDVDRVEKNDFGAVKVMGSGLLCYSTRYGSGSLLLSPPGNQDLDIPKREAKIIRQLAADLNLHKLSAPEILTAVRSFFEAEFTYSLKSRSRLKNSTPINNFLIHTRSGHCEYFATATVLLLRQAGVPARYARGYAVNPADNLDGWSLVRARYAHAWSMAYVGNRWVNLDTTPATWAEMETEQQPIWQNYLQKIKDVMSAALFRVTQWRQALQSKGYLKYSPFLLLPLIIWIFGRIRNGFLKGRKPKKNAISKIETQTVTAGNDSAFYQIENRLSELGLRRNSWETLSTWLDRIESTWGRKVPLEVPRKLLALHYRYRFDPLGLSAEEKEQMMAESTEWLSQNDLRMVLPEDSRQSKEQSGFIAVVKKRSDCRTFFC